MKIKMTEKEKKNFVVKKAKSGLGVFVKKEFVVGEVLFMVRGVFVSCDVDDEIDEETRSNTYRYDEDVYLSPKGYIANFLNHSCEPNAKLVKEGNKLFIQAIRIIQKGFEVTFDYSTMLASDDIWEMECKCSCGSKSCRTIINRFDLLPKKIKEKYTQEKIVPEFILEI